MMIKTKKYKINETNAKISIGNSIFLTFFFTFHTFIKYSTALQY